MSTQRNKEIVGFWFERISAADTEGVLALMTEDFKYWVAGKPGEFALAGTRTRAEYAQFLQGILDVFPKGLKLTPKGFTAEGDRVAAEAESYGLTTSGKIYNNVYHFLFEMRGERIQNLREYPDTMHAQRVLVG